MGTLNWTPYLLDNVDYAFLFDSSLSILKIIPGWAMRVFNAGIWFSAGFLLHKLGRYNLPSPVWPYFLLLVFSIISFSMFYENKDVSMYCNIVGNWFLYFILAFSGIGISFIVCRYLIKECKIIEWVGTYTIIILAIHEPIKRIVLFILKKVTGIDIYFLQRDVFYAFIISLCVLCMCVPIILIFRWLKINTGKFGQNLLSFVR